MMFHPSKSATWRRKRILLPLILLAACTIAIVTLPFLTITPKDQERLLTGGVPTQAELQPPFHVLVWNIAKGRNDVFPNDFQLLSNGKSLLLIQEFHNTRDVETALLEQGGFDYQIAVSFRYWDKTSTGVATGAVAPSVATQSMITHYREPLVRTPKAALITEYAIANSESHLLVVNIHGINVAGFQALRAQLEQIKPEVERHSGPILFGGDFNTNTQKKLEFVLKYMQELGLTEVKFEDDERMTAPFGSIPLDYVFTRGVVVNNAEVKGKLEGSDHKALVLAIDIE